jgi:subtilase family serine protease
MSSTEIRIIAFVAALIVLAVIIWRRKSKVSR